MLFKTKGCSLPKLIWILIYLSDYQYFVNILSVEGKTGQTVGFAMGI